MNNSTLSNGSLLQDGRYRIVRFISSGGFGCTYEAMHVMLGKRVAIKEFFVKDFCNRDEETSHVTVGTQSKAGLVEKLRTKFIAEARALSELRHPGIVSVSDVFTDNNTAYFVMEYIDGPSLEDIIKKEGPMSEARAVKYIQQVLSALKYVHAHNRLHLDIKPGNVMVDSNDRAVLIDFGASKQYDEVDGENTSTLLGVTPGFAPLEQMGNDVATFLPSTDIYAVGCTLYKLLTGKSPISATRRASGEELPPLPPTVSTTVKNAVEASMQLNKARRPQSVDQLVDMLSQPDTVPPIPQKKPEDAPTPQPQKKTPMPKKEELKPSPAVKKPDAPKPAADDSSQATRPVASAATANASISTGKPAAANIGGTPPHPARRNGMKNAMIILPILAVLFVVGLVAGGIVLYNIGSDDTDIPDTDSLIVVELAEDREFFTADSTRFLYTGSLDEDSRPSGKGVGKYEGDEPGIYEGEYVAGMRQGEGHFVTNDSTNIFHGTFENDKYKHGTLTFSDGSVFEGDFKNEALYNGKITYPDKTYFIGEFKDNAPWNGTQYHADNKVDFTIANGEAK